MQPGKDHMVSILEVGMNNLGCLQSQICFVKRVSSDALSEEGPLGLKRCKKFMHSKVAQYTLPLLHCVTPCCTTSLYHCYTALHHVAQHHSATATLRYTVLHNITLPLLHCVTPCCPIHSTTATLCHTMLHNITLPLLHCITPCCTILTP